MIPVSILVGKAVRAASRLRGSGSALPGLVVERFDPGFLAAMLSRMPQGVVVVSGTNGKTTTTKMVVELLASQGLKVFTNRSGSNFTRGVVASLVAEASVTGRLDADIAVLELDEAHAVHFVRQFQPTYALLLNVLRDQLDRFGEIDTTARFLDTIASRTTGTVVLNREDPRVARIAEGGAAHADVAYFGLAPQLRRMFPADDDLRRAAAADSATPADALTADVLLASLEGEKAEFDIGGRRVPATMSLKGVYNVYNAAAALALVRRILGDAADEAALVQALENVTPAFGRGESFVVNGQPLELVLVKNPAGFRLGLQSFVSSDAATMIAVNDDYADGRDMSWLWDVDFDILRSGGVDRVSGVRAADMALRLKYDDVPVGEVDEDLAASLEALLKEHPDRPKRIFSTYTAMLALRRALARHTTVEDFS
ncbi:MurT ligase domain-containing protein [Falsarthrobacter nasiphocae]|uniref:Lipid II isoglutaminyl synthase (glutamine-hydrolyzing) subunit MurT n=1 Tax=Falsarthrobacter nasiphocae TaxID=189863 RepID=A0AAE4C7X1_9MICC|nr:MurT ligase domain-containing protein [Falsarthrobacter nasiphocae]MDR6892959.1 UDP-N-acetylmuramyl tripeptide synthase [Falsarthrobacter nasiphocae]